MTALDFAPALAALDALIATELQRLRARYALSLDEFRGLYVSDAMIDGLLAQSGIKAADSGPRLSAPLIAPVAATGRFLGLEPLGCAMLMLALAPELDAKYPTIFAYLNDDVMRRWPTLDLAVRLFVPPGNAPAARQLRAMFAPGVPMAAGGLVADEVLVPAEPDAPPRPLLLCGWRVSPALGHFLLGLPGLPLPELAWLSDVPSATEPSQSPKGSGTAVSTLLITGPAGSGRRTEAVRWAAQLGLRAMLYRPEPAESGGAPVMGRLREASLTARLNGAALVLDLAGATPPAVLRGLDADWPIAVIANAPGNWTSMLAPRLVEQRQLKLPGAQARVDLWRTTLAALGHKASAKATEAVADRFALGAPAIARAARRISPDASAVRVDAPDAHSRCAGRKRRGTRWAGQVPDDDRELGRSGLALRRTGSAQGFRRGDHHAAAGLGALGLWRRRPRQ